MKQNTDIRRKVSCRLCGIRRSFLVIPEGKQRRSRREEKEKKKKEPYRLVFY